VNNQFSIFTSSQLIILILGFLVNDYSILIIVESLIILFFTLDKWGNGIIFREVVALHSVLVLLLMPLVGYHFYSINNSLSRIWVKYMPIDEYEYYHFVFPAVLFYITILCWPIKSSQTIDEGPVFVQKIQHTCNSIKFSSINPKTLLIVSSIPYLFIRFLPVQIQYIGYLFFTASFASFLMLYMDKSISKRQIYIYIYLIYILYLAIDSTMFTIIIYMGLTIFSFFFLEMTLSFWKKLTWFVIISFLVLSLQSVKGTFRSGTNNQNRAFYLFELLIDETSKGYQSYSSDRFFSFYTRANQGFMVAKVINFIPKNKAFDNGKYLGTAFLSSLIPRIFWIDKPNAGGKFTTKYFTGEELVGNTSMNVSPVGEAYGSFGPIIGIIYMGVLALFIRTAYITFLSLSNQIPLLIFWFPVVFFQVTYSMETDSLQIFNSLIKSGIFIFVLYTISPGMFGVNK
jgi:hypothetical protein